MTVATATHQKGAPSLPKIFAVGGAYTPALWQGEVEVTEKVDGSQFTFGVDENGTLVHRSKGQQIHWPDVPNLFTPAVDYVRHLHESGALAHMKPGTFLYGETLAKPKHNTLAYERTPKNNIILFAGMTSDGWMRYEDVKQWGAQLDLEVVPLLFKGQGGPAIVSQINEFLERESVLGKETVEGVVVKNFEQLIKLGPEVVPSFAKLVRADFKERNHKAWDGIKKAGGIDSLLASLRTEARWDKAIQHLRDDGKLTGEPKDIGPLVLEIQRDLFEEEDRAIKDELFNIYKGQMKRSAVAGFPEYYKAKLAAGEVQV